MRESATDIERSFCFTMRAERQVWETVEDGSFADADADMIFETLRQELRVTPFSEYLKRYVFLKSKMYGSFRAVSQVAWQETIMQAFRESGTPASMAHSEVRLSARTREWLGQTTVRRDAALLIGFGLSMSAEDVNEMLTRALHDRKLDPEKPMEAICEFCYAHGYRYNRMNQLRRLYEQTARKGLPPRNDAGELPEGWGTSRKDGAEEYVLMERLMNRKDYLGLTSMQNRARFHFERMYQQACELLEAQDRQTRVTPQTIEEVLFSSVLRNQHGNLVAGMRTETQAWLARRRMNRQRLHQLLNGAIEPNRYDLITMRFLNCAMGMEEDEDPRGGWRLSGRT